MTRPFQTCLFIGFVALTACSDIPDFADDATANAPYPKIVSMNDLLAQVPEDHGGYGTDSLATRAAALRARAERLRRTTVGDG
ncbi:hypothetical protein SAMN04488030_0981 [Aliiroseovarius halocynthiae]|uniref:Uncharacterized protein n=1 Tax=Aliiroseovarius halocynthiae TaxID=985055 RepID=A0A545SVB4_9RHOB|nr:hypothetical protein [Aliiroseovarius halocynthiae]TQV68912.1 hypothetical protein FIL88_04880 [Aliiroseovarius halocynthiae]SMR71508.1 hypothetical protein SAMN04488030_0981 [Aliiroseovarius halocynthiae]